MIASAGQLVASGPRFSYADYQVTSAVIDVDHTRMQRARTGSYQPVITEGDDHCVDVPFAFAPRSHAVRDITVSPWELGEHLKEEEFTRAVSLGLFDYLRKSRSRGVVVSVSGGADSAAGAGG